MSIMWSDEEKLDFNKPKKIEEDIFIFGKIRENSQVLTFLVGLQHGFALDLLRLTQNVKFMILKICEH